MLGPSDLLRDHAARHPDSTALIDGSSRFTAGELDGAVSSAACALIDAGMSPGDRVALQLGSTANFVVLYLGALRAGLIAVPINPAYTPPEVAHVLADARVSLHLDTGAAAELLATAPAAGDPQRDRGGEEIATLLYTSGTSGLSKGAMLPARALLANVDQLASVEPALLTGDDVLFVPLPLTHIFGLNAGLGMALRTGATLVLADRFDPALSLETMARERVTAVLGVPGQFAAWLGQPALREGFAAVRLAMSGSTTLGRGVVEGYRAVGVTVYDGYGLTEAAPVVTSNAVGPRRDRPTPGSIGLPLPGVVVELRDADGEPVDDGDPGRIFIRGANLFRGYWPDESDGPDTDGWFGTGDIAVADEDGQLHLVGRSTDLIVVNGFNVYPAEVEAVLAAHPAVAEVAVVGAADSGASSGSARSTEQVRAYVVPAAGMTVDPQELLAVAARSLARFKLPRQIEIVSALPHTVTGKIMKWQVRGATG